jgi:alpha/beta superfamily hydrolase
MHFKVVFRMARALTRAGFGVLRFNFRGVGGSQGSYDEGRGERDDFRSALDEAERRGGTPMVAAGFSFGSTVALFAGAADARVTTLIGAGVPIGRWNFTGMARVRKPTLLIAGGNDPYCAEKDLRRAAPTIFSDAAVVVLEGVDHFFTDALDRFEDEIFRFTSTVGAGP